MTEPKCLMCGRCCRVLIFKIGKIDEVASSYLKVRGIKQDGERIIVNHKCPQLNSKGKCMIHDYKPLACKWFPYDKENKITKHLLPEGCAFADTVSP